MCVGFICFFVRRMFEAVLWKWVKRSKKSLTSNLMLSSLMTCYCFPHEWFLFKKLFSLLISNTSFLYIENYYETVKFCLVICSLSQIKNVFLLHVLLKNKKPHVEQYKPEVGLKRVKKHTNTLKKFKAALKNFKLQEIIFLVCGF